MLQSAAVAAPARIYAFLAIGLVAASQSANIIRIGDAHPIAIAAWRLLLAALLFAPLAARHLRHLVNLGRRDKLLLLLTAAFLATHFFTWIAAVQNTTVANASIVLALTPVFAALGGWSLYGEPVGRRLAVAIAIGIAGAATIGLDDLSLQRDHLAGDGLAFASTLLFAAYLVAGGRLNRLLPTPAVVFGIYGIAGVISLVCLAALAEPIADYSSRNWVCFVLMAIVPTGIGHTAFNAALGHLRTGWVSATTLVEPLLAGLVAFFAWDEQITPRVGLGYLLICASVLVMVSARSAPGSASTGREA
jgi:drug/metabolite transporter (DMT)-like permease